MKALHKHRLNTEQLQWDIDLNYCQKFNKFQALTFVGAFLMPFLTNVRDLK